MARVLLLLMAAALAVVLAGPTHAQYVERRGGAPTVHGEILGVDDAGVTVQTELGAEHFIPWDRVRDVVSPVHQREIDRRMEDAVNLWRARSRVERHDARLAEPLFEALFEQYRGRTHETALVVAEGLLRCRLARGAHALAVVPWLEVARLRRAGVITVSYTQLAPIYDEETSLCPPLAPFWIASPGLEKLRQELREFDSGDDEVVDAMSRQFAAAVDRVRSGADGESGDCAVETPEVNHEGVRLLNLVVRSMSNDAAIRRDARERLLNGAPRWPDFAGAWVRFFAGVSYLQESGEVQRQRGLLNLLHLPPRYGESHQYLAGVAMRIAADVLESMDRPNAAQALRNELITRYPYHPARGAEISLVAADDDGKGV